MGLMVSSSPHIKSETTVRGIMLDVILMLLFPLGLAAFLFGVRALIIAAVSVSSCVIFEYFYRRVTRKSGTVGDLSAVVTGLLLALTLPASVPYWMPVVGGFFAIVIVKQLFGGLGQNFMNPALGARAFLFSWPAAMTAWPGLSSGGADMFKVFSGTDAVSAATPLKALKIGETAAVNVADMFWGQTSGSMGEVSAFLLLVGGAYLCVRRVITPRIPLAFIGTVAVLTFIAAPDRATAIDFCLAHVLSGGLIMGAVFMATDYSTTPVTKTGRLLFGIGCGALTVFIRLYGSMPEGVCYAIILMNCLSGFLDKIGKPRRFGGKPAKEKEGGEQA